MNGLKRSLRIEYLIARHSLKNVAEISAHVVFVYCSLVLYNTPSWKVKILRHLIEGANSAEDRRVAYDIIY